MKITPCNGPLGAEVTEIELRQASDADIEQISTAWGDHGVLFFREQALDASEHERFAARLGEIDVNRFFRPVEGHPRVAEVRKEPTDTTNIGGGWHTDHSYDQIPARGSILHAKIVPPKGGDTRFLSVAAALTTLDDDLRSRIVGRRAIHSSAHVFGATSAYTESSGGRLQNPDAVGANVLHPIVIGHPQTGVPLLYVNPAFTIGIEGLSDAEGRELLDALFAHMAKDEHWIQFTWEVGSLAMWDNRSTWHWALNDYDGHARLMNRITMAGDALQEAVPAV